MPDNTLIVRKHNWPYAFLKLFSEECVKIAVNICNFTELILQNDSEKQMSSQGYHKENVNLVIPLAF